MAKPRLKPSGKWEIGLRHPSLPNGRKYFTFDTEAEAIAYGQQWKLMKHADIPPPAELTAPTSPGDGVRLLRILGEWSDSGFAAPSQILTLKTLTLEVGSVRFSDANYKWLTGYLRSLKVEKNLSPSSIKHRIQALSRAIDEYLRHNVNVKISNPVKLLPKGYSTYPLSGSCNEQSRRKARLGASFNAFSGVTKWVKQKDDNWQFKNRRKRPW